MTMNCKTTFTSNCTSHAAAAVLVITFFYIRAISKESSCKLIKRRKGNIFFLLSS